MMMMMYVVDMSSPVNQNYLLYTQGKEQYVSQLSKCHGIKS